MAPATEPIEARIFDDVTSFVGALAEAAVSHSANAARPLFRGHGDADWLLLPTAWRDDNLNRYDPTAPLAFSPDRQRPTLDADTMWRHEVLVLARFLEQLTLRGHDTHPALADAWRAFSRNGYFDSVSVDVAAGQAVPQQDHYPALAVARHHGLPTRLLDWTSEWQVAAYFAAYDALERRKRPRALRVWRLVAPLGNLSLGRVDHPTAYITACHYRCRPFSSSNRRMLAQRGEFTALLRGPVQPLDEAIAAACEADPPLRDHLGLQAFDLSSDHAPALLSELRSRGVDGGLVYPDLEGVVRATREGAMAAVRRADG